MNETKIRILIVDDSPTMRHALAQLIEAQPDMELLDMAASGHEAVRRAAELQPDIVLMDLHMPDMDGIQATWLVASKSPHGAVIMVTSEDGVGFLQRAMAAGAQSYVLKPFGDGEELLRTVRDTHDRAAARRSIGEVRLAPVAGPPKVGKRIAVFGTKGGVGKTAVAVNLALGLHDQARDPVMLFDADFLFGDANVHFDLATEHSILDLVPHIDALDSNLINQVIAKHASGVHLLPSPPRPEQAEVISADHVRAVLGILATMYDYTIVDTQPSYDERMLAVLDLADLYVVVMVGDLGALRNTRHFLEVARSLGYPEERMCFVLNRANSLVGVTFDDVKSVLGTRRILQLPSAGLAVSRSINSGLPLYADQPRSPFSRALSTVVDHVRLLASASGALPAAV